MVYTSDMVYTRLAAVQQKYMSPPRLPQLSNTEMRTPRFRQIADDLRERIVSGRLKVHTALPSERTVAEQHGVSRMTARRALEAIEAEGLAYSKTRRGRFVSPKRLNYNVNSMANFVADAEAGGVDLKLELIDSGQNKADSRLAGILGVKKGRNVYQYTRIFRNQSHAIFLEKEYIVATHRKALLGANEALPLKEQRFSPMGHSADIVIRSRSLQPEEFALLGVTAHQAGIEQEQIIRNEAGVVFCFCHQIWRGELAEFSAQAIVNR